MNAGNGSVAAALATLDILEMEQPYDRIYKLGNKLIKGLQQAAGDANQNLLVQGLGPMLHTGFTYLKTVNNYRDSFSYDKAKLQKFISGLHDQGIRVIGRGLWYISAAHTEQDIDQAIEISRGVLAGI